MSSGTQIIAVGMRVTRILGAILLGFVLGGLLVVGIAVPSAGLVGSVEFATAVLEDVYFRAEALVVGPSPIDYAVYSAVLQDIADSRRWPDDKMVHIRRVTDTYEADEAANWNNGWAGCEPGPAPSMQLMVAWQQANKFRFGLRNEFSAAMQTALIPSQRGIPSIELSRVGYSVSVL